MVLVLQNMTIQLFWFILWPMLRSTHNVFAFLNPCMPSIAPDNPIVCEFYHQSNLIIIFVNTDLYSWDRGVGDG